MKQEDTRQKILDKALGLFAAKGYDSVSVGEIAQAVGIKAPSLYNHFPGKQAIFDAIDTVKQCLAVFAPMIDTMTVLTANMRRAASNGFINATDCADYLVRKGLPFRSAYKITGAIVAECIAKHTTLEELPLDAYKAHSELFASDLYPEINLEACVEKRISAGGTGAQSVQTQIDFIESFLAG